MRRPLVVAAVAVALGIASPAPAAGGCHAASCVERVADKQCTQARPLSCLRYAALRHRVSFPLLRSIAWCESGLRPHARNPSGASGLMQFLPTTWALTPYRARWILSARWNALAGAWLLRRDGVLPWLASRRCWA